MPQAAKVPLNEYEFPQNKLANVQGQLEKLVAKNYYLHTSAREAYRSYILSYNSHQLKEARFVAFFTGGFREANGGFVSLVIGVGVGLRGSCDSRNARRALRRVGCRSAHFLALLSQVYNVHTLDLQAVAASFGFSNPPKARRSAGRLAFFVQHAARHIHISIMIEVV